MASLALSTITLNLFSDPSQWVTLDYASAVTISPQTPGSDTMYGNGRYGSATAGSTRQQHQVTAEQIDPPTMSVLRQWDGVMLWLRDDIGLKYTGRYLSPQFVRHDYDTYSTVTFSFSQLTSSDLL